MNWISVEDRLPEEDRLVLIWYYDTASTGYFVIKSKSEFMAHDGNYSRITNPTHWCEITEPSE